MTCTNSQEMKKDQTAYESIKDSWHKKLGHPNNKVLHTVLKSCNVKLPPSDHFMFCEACQYGKMIFLPYKISSSHAQEPLELIHYDVWDLVSIKASCGFNY